MSECFGCPRGFLFRATTQSPYTWNVSLAVYCNSSRFSTSKVQLRSFPSYPMRKAKGTNVRALRRDADWRFVALSSTTAGKTDRARWTSPLGEIATGYVGQPEWFRAIQSATSNRNLHRLFHIRHSSEFSCFSLSFKTPAPSLLSNSEVFAAPGYPSLPPLSIRSSLEPFPLVYI